MQRQVSIVVPTFNRRASLQRLLDALAEQTYPSNSFEVVVVDDGSTDGTLEFLSRLGAPYALRVLEQPHRGPAEARNLGVKHTNAPLILFLDDDCVPRPTLVAAHVEAHTHDPECAVIGPMRPPSSGRRPAWIRWEEDRLEEQYSAMERGEYACSPRQFYTANASVPRRMFIEAGGFDSTFKRAEDVELAYRMRDLGARFVFDPTAEVVHHASRSFEAWSRTPFQYGRYDVQMFSDKGQETLGCAAAEFHYRHPLNRLIAHLCIGRVILGRATILALRVAAQLADRVGARAPAALALSAIFHLLYWQGVCAELGSSELTWRWIASKGRKEAWPMAPRTVTTVSSEA